jgi:hypothetical protein
MEGLRGAISQGPGLLIFRALVFILLAYVLYYLYNWLNGGVTDMKDYILYSSPTTGLPGNSSKATVYTSANVPGIYSGGEFSVSTWVYINDWSFNNTKNKVFLTLSGGATGSGTNAFKTLVMYLGTKTNKLGVRVSYDDPSSAASSTTLLTSDQLNNIKNSISPYSDSSSDFKKCDIEQINLQKWVNITAAMSGRTLDIYIDGKLSRSCVLDGMYKVDSGDEPTLELGGLDGFGGYIGQTRVANFAYSPDQVYKHYLGGPFDNSLWATLLSQFNPAQYSFNVQANGKSIISANA